MIRYTVQGDPQFQQMLAYLTQFPKILDRNIEPGLKKTLAVAKDMVLRRVPVRTGRAHKYLETAVFGFGSHITGVVGWPGEKDAPWYINIVEYGARKHSLAPTGRRKNSGSVAQRARAEQKLEERMAKGKSLVGTPVFINGEWRTVRVHPGFSKRGFMAAGFSAALPVFQAEMQKAVTTAFNEAKQ